MGLGLVGGKGETGQQQDAGQRPEHSVHGVLLSWEHRGLIARITSGRDMRARYAAHDKASTPRIGYREKRRWWIQGETRSRLDTGNMDTGGRHRRIVGVDRPHPTRGSRRHKLLTSPRIRPQWSIVPLRPVSLDDIESIAIGAWILGT